MTDHDAATAPVAGTRWSRTWVIAVVLVVVAVVVATARAILGDWVPIGDNAFFAIRARDVFSSHIPLLGTWTSASLTVGTDVNNPGPLLFDLYAVPATVFGTQAGVAIGAALLNVASILGIAWMAHRRGGGLLVAVAMLVTAGLTWSMGSELLFDPWQPHALVLPFLCFCFLAWSLACGDLPALPWAVGVASLLVQTHLTFSYLVPALGLWGVIGLVLAARRARRLGTDRPLTRRRVALTGATTLAVGIACWLQPLAEQIGRDQNLTHLADSASAPQGDVVGVAHSVQVMAKVLSLPPWFLRPSFASAFEPAASGPHGGPGGLGLASLPSLGLAAASLLAWVAVLAGAGWFARRSGDRPGALAAVTALVGLVAGCFTAARIPTEVFGVAAHQFRWLWPLSAFAAFTVLAVLLRAACAHRPERAGVVVAAVVGVASLLAVLTLPAYNPEAGPGASTWAIPVMRDLDRQLASVEGEGPLLYDFRNAVFAEPYSTPIMAELQRRGVPFVVDDRSLVRQLGPTRAHDGDNARARIFYRLGDAALETPAGAERVAFHRGLSPAERRERERLRREIDAAGADAVEDDPAWADRLERFRELDRRWEWETIAVFVAPIDRDDG